MPGGAPKTQKDLWPMIEEFHALALRLFTVAGLKDFVDKKELRFHELYMGYVSFHYGVPQTLAGALRTLTEAGPKDRRWLQGSCSLEFEAGLTYTVDHVSGELGKFVVSIQYFTAKTTNNVVLDCDATIDKIGKLHIDNNQYKTQMCKVFSSMAKKDNDTEFGFLCSLIYGEKLFDINDFTTNALDAAFSCEMNGTCRPTSAFACGATPRVSEDVSHAEEGVVQRALTVAMQNMPTNAELPAHVATLSHEFKKLAAAASMPSSDGWGDPIVNAIFEKALAYFTAFAWRYFHTDLVTEPGMIRLWADKKEDNRRPPFEDMLESLAGNRPCNIGAISLHVLYGKYPQRLLRYTVRREAYDSRYQQCTVCVDIRELVHDISDVQVLDDEVKRFTTQVLDATNREEQKGRLATGNFDAIVKMYQDAGLPDKPTAELHVIKLLIKLGINTKDDFVESVFGPSVINEFKDKGANAHALDSAVIAALHPRCQCKHVLGDTKMTPPPIEHYKDLLKWLGDTKAKHDKHKMRMHIDFDIGNEENNRLKKRMRSVRTRTLMVYQEAINANMARVQQGGGGKVAKRTGVKKVVLGRERCIWRQGRKEFVKVKGVLVSLRDARAKKTNYLKKQ